MGQVIVRNLDDRVIAALRAKAELHGHSLEYDCFYLALAETESATLVTDADDAQVLALARRAGLRRWVRPLADFAKKKR